MSGCRRPKWSIKYKFFLAIGVIAVIFVGLLSALNLAFYDDYYLFQKQHVLIDIYEQVRDAYTGDVEQISDLLSEMENHYGVRMTIDRPVEDGWEPVYNSIFTTGKGKDTTAAPPPDAPEVFHDFLRMMPNRGDRFDYDETELEQKGYTFGKMQDTIKNNEFISIIGNLENGDRMVVRIPVAYLEENSAFTTVFLLLTSLVTLVVCIVVAFFISRQFSKPLIEITGVANSMAAFDFTKKYEVRSRDEIGQLGESINLLSEHLQQAIGELRQTNEKLSEEVEKERRIDEMRREFIINVSHELKTPIALVQGYAEGLKVNINSSEEDKNYYCDIIMDEAARMNRLVMQLLSLSRIECGNIQPELCDFELTPFVEEVVQKTRLLADEKNLTVLIAAGDILCFADYDMMERVLINYLTNAIAHTPRGGVIRIVCADEGARVRVSVENEGEQIAPEELTKIWEKFYKIDKSRNRADGGTGIGLSIVRAIMETHGGDYGVENTDAGVRFYFTIDKKDCVG
ncbi:sensor histidine kinase [Feifania hominis]|uniref:histidine kinase n=1 Tax=Feifania hominis TaxID=2763660 RepID=A0A926DE65_9FIRM|nr:HAMP domain-containing sensor histidine kinase [Feifania hominis]MBC8535679.1 HAMP domain-containing protein [Feifania hominis]